MIRPDLVQAMAALATAEIAARKYLRKLEGEHRECKDAHERATKPQKAPPGYEKRAEQIRKQKREALEHATEDLEAAREILTDLAACRADAHETIARLLED